MIVTIAFGKGGVGKTSTAHALVNYAVEQGKKVLAIDAGLQANLTFALKGNPAAPGLFAVLTGQAQITDVIQETQQAHIVSSGLNLAAAEQAIAGKPGRDFILRKALEPVKRQYDLIVIDTQPELNSLQINALSASDRVILPMQANSFSVMGLYQMQETISQVRTYCNPDLQISGIILTKYKPRQPLANDLRAAITMQAQTMGTKVFETYIREGVAVEQAQAMQQSLFEYAPRSNPAQDYRKLFIEMGI